MKAAGDTGMMMARQHWPVLANAGCCICLGLCLCGCSGGYDWTDHTALVLRPSRHQAAVAFSFGAEAPASRQDASALAGRNVAAAIGAAMAVRDNGNPLPRFDNLDVRGGRLFIRGKDHDPRAGAAPQETRWK